MVYRLFLRSNNSLTAAGVLLHTLSDLRLIAEGYAVLPLLKDGACAGCGMVSPQIALSTELPYEIWSETAVDPAAFPKRCREAFRLIREKELGFLIPVLGQELADAETAADLSALLQEDIPVAGVLADRNDSGDPQEYDRILALLEEDPGTLIICPEDPEEASLQNQLREWAADIQDWSYHKKFDHQARPGRRTRLQR